MTPIYHSLRFAAQRAFEFDREIEREAGISIIKTAVVFGVCSVVLPILPHLPRYNLEQCIRKATILVLIEVGLQLAARHENVQERVQNIVRSWIFSGGSPASAA